MKITSKPGRPGRIYVFLDGEYALSVPESLWLDSGLSQREEISEEEFEALRDKTQRRLAYLDAVNYLSRRMHSENELRTKLKRKGYPQQAVDESIEKCLEAGYLNDSEYAARLALRLADEKHWGLARIKSELFARGLSREDVDAATKELSERDFVPVIKQLIQTRYKSRLAQENGRSSVFASLSRLGFSSQDIRSAMSEFFEEDDYFE